MTSLYAEHYQSHGSPPSEFAVEGNGVGGMSLPSKQSLLTLRAQR